MENKEPNGPNSAFTELAGYIHRKDDALLIVKAHELDECTFVERGRAFKLVLQYIKIELDRRLFEEGESTGEASAWLWENIGHLIDEWKDEKEKEVA